MSEVTKPKRPVPPQFLKKKKPVEPAQVEVSPEFSPAEVPAEKLPDPTPETPIAVEPPPPIAEETPPVDMEGLVRDLVLNRYFRILEKEARPIAEKMVKEGAQTLHDVKWFLARSERVELAQALSKKYGIRYSQ